ncbi:hypothetical protein AX16_010679 [Volvariella volvacea WC 439]|nr:hypothetical protein AX16_010679 [Volvariella volvacea WC 439]
MRARKTDSGTSVTTATTTTTATSLPLYESHPPYWLPRAHLTADLGYPGFHPPRPGQEEDVLTESNVRNGFTLNPQVQAESFSAFSLINDSLQLESTLEKLGELMNDVFIKRLEKVPAIPPSTFRIPTRVTLNDAKRQAWLADLADPSVPLYKLGKSVPHGAKGHDLLDLLHTNNVAIPRAVWVVRVLGANETAGLRNRPSYNPTQYSIDWASLVTSYMKKQLADIALPSAPRPGLNIKQTFKGVLADTESRERWISRFTYCLKLLRTFYAEGLVDKRTFLVWVVSQMSTCNLAQAGFITRLADEYLEGVKSSRALARPFVEACLCKLSEIRSTSARETLTDTDKLLVTILQRLCLEIPDAFVSPSLWVTYAPLMHDVLSEYILDRSNDQDVEQQYREISQFIYENKSNIQRRNEAMLFRHLPLRTSTGLCSAVSDVELLNSISVNTDLYSLTFFPPDPPSLEIFKSKLHLLLTWSVTPMQYGDHRPLASVTLLKAWRDKANERAIRRDSQSPDEFLQDHLFEWLDNSEVASDPANLQDIALLYGKLVKEGLFSYSAYIQRLIARGEPALNMADPQESRHRNFLRWIPLSYPDPAILMQRKVTLYGARVRETLEDTTEREMRKEIRSVLPELFGGDTLPTPQSTHSLMESCPTFVNATRYEQIRTLRQWLLPIIQRSIASEQPNATHPALLRTYCVSVELMTQAKCFHIILELTMSMLDRATTSDVLTAVIETLYRFSIVWSCMGAMSRIILALDAAHQEWKARGVQSRALLSLILEFDNGRFMTEENRERIISNLAALTLAFQPMVGPPNPAPDILPEVLHLADDDDPNGPRDLATSLWIKYRTSPDWAWKVWDNTIASIQQIPIFTEEVDIRRAYALKYGALLWQVDQHLPHGINDEILRWLLGPGKIEVARMSTESWQMMNVILVYLVIHGALKTTTVLSGLVYPAWQLGASTTNEIAPAAQTVILACNDLCRTLMLTQEGSGGPDIPSNLLDLQCLQTRRKEVFSEPHFPIFVSSIPLLILLENNNCLSEDIRSQSAEIRNMLCQDSDCRQGAHRNLGAIRDAFEQSLHLMDETSENVSKTIVSGLRILLGDASDDIDLTNWPAIHCLLSPWKIAATTLQFQFLLRQMGRAMPQDAAASNGLDKLTLMIFRHSMTSEQAYHFAQMARGVDAIVATKFINNGLKCIGELLKRASLIAGTLGPSLERASELLRVLAYVAEPFRDDLSSLPTLEPSIQNEFFTSLCMQIMSLESTLTRQEKPEHIPNQFTQEITLLARLLQFNLGFKGVWTVETKGVAANLSNSLLKLALFYGAGDGLDLVAYPLLIDTLIYLCDEIPSDNKTPTFEPFQSYPSLPISDLPTDLPPEYRAQLLTLLPQLSAPNTATNLVTSYRDGAGNLVHGSPVINRPWEWIENLGEPSILDPKEEEREKEEKARLKTKYLVKNSGSLSLETFGARMTGDGVAFAPPQDTGAGAPTADKLKDLDMKTRNALKMFEDGLTSETIFSRDWRETKMEVDPRIGGLGSPGYHRGHQEVVNVESHGSNTGMNYGFRLGDKRPPSRASPTSSIGSRTSGRSRFSPAHSSLGRNSDVMDAEMNGSGGTGKRKASGAVDSDDEIEIIEGPTFRNPAKKVKGKTAGKTKAKKR